LDTSYRCIVVASQSVTWLVGQLLKLRFASEMHQPAGLFELAPEKTALYENAES
jgi:hypothetical protein